MSATLAKRSSEIRVDILALQDWLGKYQQLVPEHQAIRSDTMRAKAFFERLVWQIDNAIPQIALFTLISKYQDDRTQYRFYQLLDYTVASLRDFYDAYQEKRYGRLFDIDELIHTCRADTLFIQLDSLFKEATKSIVPTIIKELS
jgi:hypothetical protein